MESLDRGEGGGVISGWIMLDVTEMSEDDVLDAVAGERRGPGSLFHLRGGGAGSELRDRGDTGEGSSYDSKRGNHIY